MSEPGYESYGYERSIGTKRLVTFSTPCPVTIVFMHLACVAIFCDSRS